MAILTHKCPHCLTEHIGHRIAAVSGIQGWTCSVHLTCPKCDMPSCAKIQCPVRQSLQPNIITNHQGDVLKANWVVVSFWPEPPGPLIPELLPPDVERVYLQAERNFPVLGNEEAAGSMYGKALDIGLKKIDPDLSGMLGPRIQKLSDAGKLTADIAVWSKTIKDTRNDAVHEESPITRDELIELRNFTEMVLRYLFSLPGAVKRRRGEKLAWEVTP